MLVRTLLAVSLLAPLSGCELLQLQKTEPDDGRTMMMMADQVPLGAEEDVYAGGGMPVPVEPSPFEISARGRPAAMLSDVYPPTSPAAKSDGDTWAIPKEPIP